MRVLEVSTRFPTEYHPWKGIFVKQAVEALHRKGVEVEVVSPKPYTLPVRPFPFSDYAKLPDKEFIGYWVHYPRFVYFVPKRCVYQFTGDSFSYYVSRYLRTHIRKPDLIHAQWAYTDGYGMMQIAKWWDIPLIITVRGTMVRKTVFEWKSLRLRVAKALRFADVIITVSQELVEGCLRLGVGGQKIRTVPNGVDTEVFKRRDKMAARKRLSLPMDRPILLFVGSLEPVKGIDVLVKSLPAIVSNNSDALLVFVGDGVLKKMIVQQTRPFNNNVLFPGERAHSEVPLWMNSSDLLVLPSLSEGRPNVVLEAMSSGVPVVATRVGGIPELVRDGENGFLVEPRDPEEMAAKVGRLLNNAELRMEMGIKGETRVEREGLSWENHSEKIIRVYEEVLNQQRYS